MAGWWRNKRGGGQSTVEVLIAVGVFAVLASGLIMLVFNPLTSAASAADFTKATFLATQGLEAARAIKEQGWTSLAFGTHGLARDMNGNWIFSGASDTVEGTYVRSVTVTSVERDGGGNIVPSGGNFDPRTKKATVTVTWTSGLLPIPRSVTRSGYLTDWAVYEWLQTTDTDFGGGLQFLDTAIVGTGVGATLTLAIGVKDWTPRNNTPIVHTTDEDWNGMTGSATTVHDTQAEFSGTFSNTQWDAGNLWLELSGAGQLAGTGTYTSPIDGSTSSATWSTLGWVPQRPAGKQLPDAGAAESGYAAGNVDMTGNRLLLHFNEGPGATSFPDTSGNSNNGSCSTCPTSAYGSGRFDGGATFNGTTQNVTVNDAASLDLTSAVSVAAWVQSNAPTTPLGDVSNAVIDTLEFDTGNGRETSVLKVADGIFAVTYSGGNNDGFVRTFSVDAAGAISNATIDSLEFDTDDGRTTSLRHVSGDIYIVAYQDTNGGDTGGWLATFTIDSAGNIGNSVIDTLRFDTTVGPPHLAMVSATIGAVVYRGSGDDGFAATFSVDGSGNISNAVIDTLEFDTSNGWDPYVFGVGGTTYAVAYRGVSNDGFLASFSIDGSGNIGNSVIDTLEFDTSDGYDPRVERVAGDYFAVAYTGPGTDGFVKTVTIDSSGNIGNSVIDTLEFDTSNGQFPDIVRMGDGVFAIPYVGPDADGWVASVTITDAGDISSSVIDTLEFNTSDGNTPKIVRTTDDIALVTYTGPGTDGWSATFRVSHPYARGVYKPDAYGISAVGSTAYGFIGQTGISAALASGWNHVVMTYDSAAGSPQLRLYVNGTQAASQTLTSAITANDLAMQVGRYLNGTLDEVAVFNRALTPAEVTDHRLRGALRLRFQVRSCDDAACSGESFIGPDGGPTSFYSNATSTSLTPQAHALTNLASNPYFQYRATFETDDATATPELKSVTYGMQMISGSQFNGTTVVGVGVPASVEEVGTPQWALAGPQGASVYHTTDTDFAGTHSQTAVGGSGTAGQVGLAYVLDWRQFPSPTVNDLQDAYIVSSTDGWAVGLGGTIIRYDGTEWTDFASPVSEDLYDVTISSPTDGWAVGLNGEVLRWNGAAWTDYADFTGEDLWEVSCVAANACWISGNGGEIWYWNGTTWVQQATGSGAQLFDVHMVNASLGWAAGTANTLLKWNGSTWSNDPHPGNETWRDVHGRDANFGFLAGTNGVIEKWDGASWTIETTPGTPLLRGLEMLSPTFAFAVGDGGAIWRWEDGDWSADASPSVQSIKDVQPVATEEAWAVAAGGEVLHYGLHYYTSGQYFSTIIDGGTGADWGTATWGETLPAGTDLTIAFRSGNTPTPDGSWSGWSSEVTTSPAAITSATSRYLQYRVSFTSTHPHRTGYLNDILITYNEPPSSYYRAVSFPATNDGWLAGDGGALARWNGTTWTATSTVVADNLNDVHCLTTASCWSVGAGGKILRWNGTSWTQFVDTGAQAWASVFCNSASDCWTVTTSGVIYRYNGTSWSLFVDTGGQNWNDVFCRLASDCWVVGTSGQIYRFNGTTWSLFVDTGGQTWNDVWINDASDGWVVGSGGAIYRWNGAAWSSVASGTANDLLDAHCVTTSDCWAVGASGTILRWNGSAWSVESSPTGNALDGMRMISANDVFAVGASGTIVRYTTTYPSSATYLSATIDGGSPSTTWDLITWTANQPIGTDITIATRSGPTPTPGGAGWSSWSTELTERGGSFIASPANRYMQYRATFTSSTQLATARLDEVQVVTNASTRKNLFGTEGSGVNDVWAVGRDGTIVRYNGTQWSQIASPVATDLLSVDTVSASEAYAVGVIGGGARWNGTTWTAVSMGTTNDLYSVSMVDSSFGVAVGSSGTIRHWNGSVWNSASSTDGTRLRGVSMLGASDGFAVGDGGKIIRWNGSSWGDVASPTVQNLHSVHMLNASSGWAVGEGGTILRWNGSVWSTVTSPVSTPLYGVEARTASNAWAVGAYGRILEWDGSAWTVFTTPVTLDLYDLTVYNPTDGWIAGQSGMLMKDPILYAPSGEFYSSVLDTDSATSTFMTAMWNASTPVGTTATVAVRTGNVATPDGTWSAFTAEMTSSTGTAITAPAARYLQYRVLLSTTDQLVSPIFQDITVTYR